jgi:ABC-type transporter MlaC component
MARLSVGSSWATLNEAQRQQVTESFGRYISAISEVATRRSEFAAILKKEGIDGLNRGTEPQGRYPHRNHSQIVLTAN